MRGKGYGATIGEDGMRITPAYAGKRQFCPPAGRTDKDHPRMCGEKMMKAGSNCAMLGSPPHMRGKGQSNQDYAHQPGITPAYAGKRPIQSGLRSPTRDHPRVCGEKRPLMPCASSIAGSPPRMRGKAFAYPCVALCHGITPAYAGKRMGCSRPLIRF